MLSLTLAALLGSSPVSIGVLTLSSPDLAPKQLEALVDHLAVTLEHEQGVTVVTTAQIAQLLGLERQRQLAGCDAQAECLTELSGALGVRFLLTGSAKRLGTEWLASLRLVDTTTTKAIDSGSVRAATEPQLYDGVAALATRFTRAAKAAVGLVEPVVKAAGPRQLAWVPWVVGGALSVGAIGCLIGSQTDAASLRSGSFSDGALVHQTAVRGQVLQTTGWALGAAALAAGVTGLIFWLLGDGGAP